MPIAGSKLGSWSHHHSGKASIQTHVSIRKALDSYALRTMGFDYDIFLQGSYKNDTNLRKDSDVDVVMQLTARVRPHVIVCSSAQLEQDQSHRIAYQRWRSFRDQVVKALRTKYGSKGVTSGRKSLKIVNKNQLQAAADVVVTLHFKEGLTFYLPDECRWVISYPQQHYERGLKKEGATNNNYKRIIRMFKAARNHLENNDMIRKEKAPSYFLECLLYNVPNKMFTRELDQSYRGIIRYLENNRLDHFKCRNGIQELFGSSKDLWNQSDARAFIRALHRLWDEWTGST